MSEDNHEFEGIPCPNCGELIDIQVVEPYGDAAPFKESLTPEQLHAEADMYDTLVRQRARFRIIGPGPEDSGPVQMRDRGTLSENDRHRLAELFWKQSIMYRELADQFHETRR
jgi:hypothetical protein